MVSKPDVNTPFDKSSDKGLEPPRRRDMQHALTITPLGIQIDTTLKQQEPRFVTGVADVDKGAVLFIGSTCVDVKTVPKQQIDRGLPTSVGRLRERYTGLYLIPGHIARQHQRFGYIRISPAER